MLGEVKKLSERYFPDPNCIYPCPYCNKPTKLREKDVVVDSYMNVCHYGCLIALVGAKLEVIEDQKEKA